MFNQICFTSCPDDVVTTTTPFTVTVEAASPEVPEDNLTLYAVVGAAIAALLVILAAIVCVTAILIRFVCTVCTCVHNAVNSR